MDAKSTQDPANAGNDNGNPIHGTGMLIRPSLGSMNVGISDEPKTISQHPSATNQLERRSSATPLKINDSKVGAPSESKSKNLRSLANSIFQHFVPFGKTVVLQEWEALVFLAGISLLPVATFALMMYYFLYAGCIPLSLTFSGVPAQASITKDVLNSVSYYVCATGYIDGLISGCCTISGVKMQSSNAICNIYNQEIAHCSGTTESSCYASDSTNYSLIGVSLMTCATPASAVTNSIQYSLYVSTAFSVLFVGVKMIRSKGCRSVTSGQAWSEFIKEESV